MILAVSNHFQQSLPRFLRLTLSTYYGLPVEDAKDIAKNVLEIVKG